MAKSKHLSHRFFYLLSSYRFHPSDLRVSLYT